MAVHSEGATAYPLDDSALARALTATLPAWELIAAPMPDDPASERVELHRELRFQSFHDAIDFMVAVAPACDRLDHHPRWENSYKTLNIYLSTWSIGRRVSNRDIRLAQHIDRAYAEYLGSGNADAKS